MTQAANVGQDRYAVERTLGRGGMATVYLAQDGVLGRPVALKVLAEHLADDDAFRARFLREAKLAARVTHPNVVQVYDAGEDGSSLYIAMEYVAGETLAEEIARRGCLAAADVVDLGLQLCSALDASHAAGLVHRDVKPQNVLRAHDGTVKLGDFGIARSHDATALTEHGSVLGTAAYLAPEQARGEPVTGAADLYALGVLLYEALTGRRPYEGANLAELVLRRESEPVLPPSVLVADVPPALDRAILGCLALHPAQRPASAAALACELAAAMPEAVTRPVPVPTETRAFDVETAATVAAPTPAPPSSRSHRGRLVGAAAVVAALVAGVVFAVLSTGGSDGTGQEDATATTRVKASTNVPVVARQPTTTAPVVALTPPPKKVVHGPTETKPKPHKPPKAHKSPKPHKAKHADKSKPGPKH